MEIGESYIVGYFTLAFAFIQESMFCLCALKLMAFETQKYTKKRDTLDKSFYFFYLYSTIHTYFV